MGIGEPNAVITLKECRFCHSEPVAMFSEAQQRQFREQGGIYPAPVGLVGNGRARRPVETYLAASK